MHATKLPLLPWMTAMYSIANSSKGILLSIVLGRLIETGQKTTGEGESMMKPLPISRKIKELLAVELDVQIRWPATSVFMPSPCQHLLLG